MVALQKLERSKENPSDLGLGFIISVKEYIKFNLVFVTKFSVKFTKLMTWFGG